MAAIVLGYGLHCDTKGLIRRGVFYDCWIACVRQHGYSIACQNDYLFLRFLAMESKH